MSKAFGPVLFYEKPIPLPKMVMVRDQASKKRDPELEKKLARVVELLEKLVNEDRPAVDIMAAKKAQRRENARRLRDAKRCSLSDGGLGSLEDAIRQAEHEASQAAYAARNHHKGDREVPRDSRVQYPHKPRQREAWEGRLAAQDSASRFLIICEESENAYAARNPHKKGAKR